MLNDSSIPRINQEQFIEHFCFRSVNDLRYIRSPNFFGIGIRFESRIQYDNRDFRVIGGNGFIDIDRYNDAGYREYVAQSPNCPRYAIFELENITFIVNDWNRAYSGNGNILPYPGQPSGHPATIIRSDGEVFIPRTYNPVQLPPLSLPPDFTFSVSLP